MKKSPKTGRQVRSRKSDTGSQLGTYLWRGGKKIEVEKEADVLTAVVRDKEELDRIKKLPQVKDVKHVTRGVYRITTVPRARDKAMETIRSPKIKGITHHAYRPQGSAETRYYLTDTIVAEFRDALSVEEINHILQEKGLHVVKEYGPRTYLLEITPATGENPIKTANRLVEEGSVVYAEPNLVNRFKKSYEPFGHTLFRRQWHLNSHKGAQLVEGADIAAPKAWDITRGTRNVVVAVIDDGFDLNHPDFQGTGKIVWPKDYVDGDGQPFPEKKHDDYHGTPCAGVAIAEDNGKGVTGAAPGCAFMPVRFDLAADDDTLAEIFEFVGRRAHVISNSWGPPPVYAPLPTLLKNKFHDLATSGGPNGKGCVILFAAANFNAPINDPNNTGFKWRDYDGTNHVTRGRIENGQATHPDVIAVAASTSLNKKAAYSNWGKEISVCSPSDNFHPMDPDAFVPGRGIWTTDNERFGYDFTPKRRYTPHFGGTSSATPLAAGVAALVLSANPNLKASEVKEILRQTADKIVDNDPDTVLGLKKGTYDAQGHSEWFGYGKVNAFRAVQEAKRRAG